MSDNANSYPKMLIVSNNSLSNNDNNGKTILSFFKDYPSERLAQLYLRNEEYKCDKRIAHINISEISILRAIIPLSSEINDFNMNPNNEIKHLNYDSKYRKLALDNLSRLQISRIIREAIWLTGLWNTNKLRRWLKQIAPERIFFLAGDSIFAYKIVEFIKNEYNIPVTLFITDDYVLSHRFFGVFQGLRKIIIRQKLEQAIYNCSNYITISEKMRRAYFQRFRKNSLVSMYNIDSHHICRISPNKSSVRSNRIMLIYVGGLQLGRDKTIYKVINAIEDINCTNNRNVILNIYSKAFPINKAIIGKMSWEYKGILHNEKDVIEELTRADVLLFIETFSKNE